MQAQTSVPTHEIGLDKIIAELDREYDGVLPERALRAAQRRREEVAPLLIDLIRNATELARAGKVPDGAGHCFALLLLTEFRANEALPAIVEAVSLPGEGPFDLFGDSITEDLSGVLAALTADTPEVIDRLIENRSLNEYVRWAAAQSYLYLVRDRRITRDDAVGRLRKHLQEAIANRDASVASGLVAELDLYAPHEAIDDIKEAYRRELVDESLLGLDDIERSIAEGESRFEQELEACRPTGVEDTVEELRSWAAYQEDNPPQSLAAADLGWGEDLEPSAAAEPTSRRVGRNEPCPCGSGKKYKKCCGAR